MREKWEWTSHSIEHHFNNRNGYPQRTTPQFTETFLQFCNKTDCPCADCPCLTQKECHDADIAEDNHCSCHEVCT